RLAVAHQLDRGALARAAADEEARPRLHDLERRGEEFPVRAVAGELVPADPVLAAVATRLAVARGGEVAAHRLARERRVLARPVAQVARLEVGVERMAVEAERERALLARLEVAAF